MSSEAERAKKRLEDNWSGDNLQAYLEAVRKEEQKKKQLEKVKVSLKKPEKKKASPRTVNKKVLSESLVIGPNFDQKKAGNGLVQEGRIIAGFGLLMILIGLYYSFVDFQLWGSSSIFVGWFIIKYGGTVSSKGIKMLEVKFTGKIDDMSPYDFEILIDDLYTKRGYKCDNIKSSRDSGADVVAYKDGIKYVIQVKHYNENNSVGSQVIRDLYGSMKLYDAQKGIVITTSYFTSPAATSAKKMGIELIDRSELQQLIIKHYHHAS